MAAIGFVLSHEQFPAPRLLELGVAAEQAGFDMVWTSDHFHPWMHNQGHAGHAWITLAALGQRIETVAFGTGVTALSYRYNPALVAQAFASLGVLYPGRVFLGVGTGEAVNEKPVTGEWGPWEERATRMVESIQIIRRLWNGEYVTHDGKFFHMQNARLYDLPEQPVPIYIAATGPKTMRIAGVHGDGLITAAIKATDTELINEFREGARSAGKNPESLPILAELFVFVGREQDAQTAAEKWRFLPKTSKYLDVADPREIWRMAQDEVPINEVLKTMTISEDPQAHIDRLQALIDGGVTHIFVHSGQEDQQRAIDFYGRQVLLKLQHEKMMLEV